MLLFSAISRDLTLASSILILSLTFSTFLVSSCLYLSLFLVQERSIVIIKCLSIVDLNASIFSGNKKRRFRNSYIQFNTMVGLHVAVGKELDRSQSGPPEQGRPYV